MNEMTDKAKQYAQGDETKEQAFNHGFIAGMEHIDDIIRKIHQANFDQDLERINESIAQYEANFNPVECVS